MEYYKTLSVILLNSLIFFFLVNLSAMIPIEVSERRSHLNRVEQKYGIDLPDFYPLMKAEEIDPMLNEIWDRRLTYEAFTQFKEPASEGKFVNVDTAGFRKSNGSAEWPPAAFQGIFFYGGSTTFGYGLPDWLTVPSYYYEKNNSFPVYNFGRAHYYSTQELVLFFNQLRQGIRPKAAIFIDGLNDFYYSDDKPLYSSGYQKLSDGYFQESGNLLKEFSLSLPIVELYRKLERYLAFGAGNQSQDSKNPLPANSDQLAQRVVGRYLSFMDVANTLGDSFGVDVYFVWQPAPTYGYDSDINPFSTFGMGQHYLSSHGYPIIKELYDAQKLPRNFIFCADIHDRTSDREYIDLVHYSSALSKRLAECIAEKLSSSQGMAKASM